MHLFYVKRLIAVVRRELQKSNSKLFPFVHFVRSKRFKMHRKNGLLEILYVSSLVSVGRKVFTFKCCSPDFKSRLCWSIGIFERNLFVLWESILLDIQNLFSNDRIISFWWKRFRITITLESFVKPLEL